MKKIYDRKNAGLLELMKREAEEAMAEEEVEEREKNQYKNT